MEEIYFLIIGVCRYECLLNGNMRFALWGTGSQISISSQQYLTDNFPQLEVKNLEELLGEEVELDLRAANNSSIPYSAYVELEFNRPFPLFLCAL